MVVGVLFLALATGTAVDWSSSINTFLLIVLAIVSFISERYRKKEAKEVKSDLHSEGDRLRKALVEEAEKVKTNLLTESTRVRSKLEAEASEIKEALPKERDPSNRTREGDT